MKRNETVENIIKEYGKEAFQNHREEVYEVLRVLCFCMEFLQNQEDWRGRRARAIPLRSAVSQSMWEEEFWEKYDSGLRVEELWKLKEELEQEKHGSGKQIPLKRFFDQGILLLLEGTIYSDIEEDWSRLMETQMAADGYTDYRVFLEAVYMLGFYEMHNLHDGTRYHFYEGDYRDAEYLLGAFRERIPKEEYSDYDSYCGSLLGEMEKKRINAMRQTLKEWDKGLEKAAKEIPVLKRFYKAMEEMEEEAFERFVKSKFSKGYGWRDSLEDMPGWSEKLRPRSRKISKIEHLADLFLYGNSRNKQRLFRYLSEEEQMLVMEQWMFAFYPDVLEVLAVRLRNMSDAASPDMPWTEYKKDMLDSMEGITGRPFTEEDAYWI